MNFEFAVAIKTTVILGCGGLSAALLRRAPASTRHAVWTIAMLCTLGLPAAIVLLPQFVHMELPLLPERANAVLLSSNSSLQGSLGRSIRVSVQNAVSGSPALSGVSAALPWRFWLDMGWAVGFSLALSRVIVAAVASRRLAVESTPPAGEDWIRLIDDLTRQYSFSKPIDVRMGGHMPPMTWGLVKRVILLPSSANGWSADRRRAVLAHELAHVKRRDGLIQILAQLACSVYWFNPIVWFAERRMRLERECACDDYVLNLGTGAASYADHLLELASAEQSHAPFASVAIAQPSQLETRIRSILNPGLKRHRVSRRTAAGLLSFLAAIMFCLAVVQVTALLQLNLPAVAAPLVPQAQATPQQPAPPTPATGTVAGEVLWADGPPAPGTRVSALTVEMKGGQDRWVTGERIAASTLTDNTGRYRIQGLAPGRYHIVSGPILLSANYDDAAATDSPHLVTVTAEAQIQNVGFAVVRASDRIPFVPGRMLTVTGRISSERYATPGGGVFLLIPNSDGAITRWHFRRDSITLGRSSTGGGLSRLFWWPGYDVLRFETTPVAEMVAGGETVTISGTELDPSRSRGSNPALTDSRFLYPVEVTRGGR